MPSAITIHEVDTSRRREVMRFISLPFAIYQGCPQWVPPVMPDARMQLNREKNGFYRQNDAAFFIAQRGGRDVARIAALHPIYYNKFKGTNEAHFYLFDSFDDQEAAHAVLDAAADWARARGLDLLRGPLGFMAFDGFGLLAKGFEHRPANGIPYNHDYYPRLVESWGFELEERVYSGYVKINDLLANFPERVLQIAEKVRKRYGFEVRTYKNKRELVKNVVAPMVRLYNETLTHIAGDPPVAEEEVQVIVDSILLIAKPDMLKFIAKGDELVGFLFSFPNIAEGLRRCGGRVLTPWGLFHLFRAMRTTKWIDLNGMGILPRYQGAGGTALLYAELYRTLAAYNRFEHADVVQISEFNVKSLNEMKSFGVDFYKTHHIYRRAI
ncbi:MAG: GNAT family N-acetyltransferase [Anaerolineae bacterium]